MASCASFRSNSWKANVPHMRIFHKGIPFASRQIDNMDLAIGRFRRASTAKNIGSCIGGLMQDSQDVVVLNWSPGEFSLMGSPAKPSWKEQVLLVKVAHGRKSGASVLEAEKNFPDSSLY